MLSQRDMDEIKMEAERLYLEMMQEFERTWLGRRAEYGSQGEQELSGEEWGQLVQRGGEDENAGAELVEGQPNGEEIGTGAGAPGAAIGASGRGIPPDLAATLLGG
jgi:hypothetical protein